MTATLPYIRERDGVFQYERRVPLRVQRDHALYAAEFQCRPLFRRSLRTKRIDEAAIAYHSAHGTFEAMIATPAALCRHETPHLPARIVTNEDLATIAERYAAITVAPFETMHRRANVSAAAADELARLESDLEMDGEAIKGSLRSREVDPTALVIQPATEAEILIAEQGFFAPLGSEYRGAIVGAVRNGIERGYKRVSALAQGEVLPTLGTAVAPLKPVSGLMIADAVERYVTDRKPTIKTISEIRLALRQFEQAVGCKSLAAITRSDAHNFVRFLSEQSVGGKTPGSIIRPLSEQSIIKRMQMLARAIDHMRDRGLFDGDNVLKGIKTTAYAKPVDKSVMPTKRRLQISELNAIFAHPWFTGCASPQDIYTAGNHRLKGAEFWAPIIALFTGCRAAELGGLKVNEVMIDDEFPHLIIRDNEYRRTKSKRTRRVPILDALIELGFATYLNGIRIAGHDRLFPDWSARTRKGSGEGDYPAWSNSTIIRSFNRHVIPSSLVDKLPTNARREVTFHSLRGAFKAMLVAGNRVSLSIANEIIGHSSSELDERYLGEITIEETYPVVHSCTFKRLCLPASPTLN